MSRGQAMTVSAVTCSRLARKPRGSRAFSLIEIVAVVVIMGILSSIALPRYSAFIAQQQLEGAERRLVADLALAQRRARQSSASQSVVFNVGQSKYQLPGMAHPDHPGQAFEVRLGDEPYRAMVVSASFGGDATLIYDGYGNADTAGTVVIAVGSRQKTIDIDLATGKPRKLGQVQLEIE